MTSLADVFGPNNIGRNPQNEVPVWRWTDPASGDVYQISRITSNKQSGYNNEVFDVQWIRYSYLHGAVFRLDRFKAAAENPSIRSPVSIVGIEDLSRNASGPELGLDAWTIISFDRWGLSGAYSARPLMNPLELKLWVTFLLDYLQLDPGQISQSVRLRWGVPYLATQSDKVRQGKLWSQPYPMPVEPAEIMRDSWIGGKSDENRALTEWVHTLGSSFIHPQTRQQRFGMSSPNKNMLRMQNENIQIDLHWALNPTPEVAGRYPDQIVFQGHLGAKHSAWCLSPQQAIDGLNILVDNDDAIQDWIDAHVVEGGQPVIPESDFEAYLLLGDSQIPPLMRPRFFLQFLQARGVRMPWE